MPPLNDTWPSGGSSSQYVPWVEQFKDGVLHLAQQEGSRFRDTVRSTMVTGSVHNFERLGATTSVAKTTRHTTTPIIDVPHSRRRVVMADYHWAALIDREDMIRAKIAYKSEYSKNAGMAMGRRWDDIILAAALADATDGTDTAVPLPAAQTIVHGSASLTIAKLREAKYIMDSAEISSEGRILAHSAEELQNLLATTEITSSDYNTVKALVKGEVDTFLGFRFERTERLAVAAGSPNVRSCIAFQRDSMGLAVGSDMFTSVDQRPDVSYAWQVYCQFSAAATRIEDEGVVEIECVAA